METTMQVEDLVRIEKSNKAMEVLCALPANQRTTIIEGLVAAMQLSGQDLADIKRRTLAFGWWETSEE